MWSTKATAQGRSKPVDIGATGCSSGQPTAIRAETLGERPAKPTIEPVLSENDLYLIRWPMATNGQTGTPMFRTPDGLPTQVFIEKWLGDGAHATVFKGTYTDGNGRVHEVAVKIYNTNDDPIDNQTFGEVFKRECEIYKNLASHDNVVQCFGFGENCVIMERMDYDLTELVHCPEKRSELIYKTLLEIFLQIAKGLYHLYAHKVIHYDMKPENVLIQEYGERYIAKVADFGISEWRCQTSLYCDFKGTIGYMAPELIEAALSNSRVNVRKLDVFSFGVLMQECVTGQKPDPENIFKYDLIPLELFRLIQQCCSRIKDDRPDWKGIINALGQLIESDFGCYPWLADRVLPLG